MSPTMNTRVAGRPWRTLLLAVGLGLTPMADVAQASGRGTSARTEFTVVVNDDNPMVEIDRDALSKMFLKRSTSWPSGKAIQPIDLPIDNGSRSAFSRVVLHKSISAIRAYWQQQIFSGREVPPAEKPEADMLAAIKSDAGAIGYASSSAILPNGVKRITVRGIDD